MKIKLQSVLAFCGLTTIAAVYYCYYIVSNKKRKQKQIDSNLSQKSDQFKADYKNCKAENDSILQNKEEELNCEESLVITKDNLIVNNSINNSESCDLPANLVSDNTAGSHNSFITTAVSDKEDSLVQEEQLTVASFANRISESTPLKFDNFVAESEIEKMCDETNVVQTAPPQIVENQPKVAEVMVESQEIVSAENEAQKSSPSSQSVIDESNLSWASIVEETLKEHSEDTTFCPVSENSVYYVNPKSPIKSSPNKPQKCNNTSLDSSRKTAPLTQKNSAKFSPKGNFQTSQTAIKSKPQSAQKQPQVFHTSQYEKRVNNNNNSEQNQNNSINTKHSNRQKSSSKSANCKSSSPKENSKKNQQDQSILSPCNGTHYNDNVSDCSSNQENDPDAKQNSSLSRKSSSKKSAPSSGAKGTLNGDYVANECVTNGGVYEQQVEQMGAMIDQIYLNDPSVISIISPTNYSDPDSAVISCGESSLTSITYLHNGIPSPRGSVFSETSTDSGMMRSSGSPEYFNPPLEEFLSWEVEIPTHVGGKIIGKAGRNVKELRDKTGCKVIIKDIENSRRKQLLVVRGTLEQIKVCHRLLEKKFRKDIEFETGLYYTMEGLAGFLGYPMAPQMSLAAAAVATSTPAAAAATAPPTQILPAANTYLQLPQSAYFDVIVCSIKTAGHFFLQQPTHNSFFNLDRLHDCMRDCYSKPSVPELPYPIALGTISAAYLDGKWCRSQVVGVTDDENVITVRFLDMGGYREMPRHSVKQIRTDFLSLPFQATEVFLSEVTPANDEPDFSPEATKFLEELIAQSGTPQAFLKGWNMSDMPLVDLIVRRDGKFESVAQLLIDHGYAVRLEIAPV